MPMCDEVLPACDEVLPAGESVDWVEVPCDNVLLKGEAGEPDEPGDNLLAAVGVFMAAPEAFREDPLPQLAIHLLQELRVIFLLDA